MARVLVGCDVGGTFTDAFAYDLQTGKQAEAKASTTPEDRSSGAAEAIEAALARLGAQPGQVAGLLHGTTTATNALLEHELAPTALVTHRGHEDLIEIGRQDRPSLYDLSVTRPESLVPREHRYGIRGRMDARGQAVEALDPQELEALAEQLAGTDRRAVAVCLLHSYQAPEHEAAVADHLAEHLPGLSVVTSHQVSPEIREVERFQTTVINAGLVPHMEGYLDRFEHRMAEIGLQAPISVIDSAGALMSPAEAAGLPVRTLLSGPAGGAAGCQLVGRETGRADLLGVDMGGTSTDVTLIAGGQPSQAWEASVAGYRLQVPTADIHTIGAGGGSIAWLDEAGGLRLGPRSAGAQPGPACYGRGGHEPTVTDACLLLGRLPEDRPLGGSLTLDRAAAEQAMTPLADALGAGLTETARAVLEVATAHAVRGMQVLTARHGVDPGRLTLVAFGGAGPLFSAEWATRLGAAGVIIPATAGVHSAVGLLAAPPRTERARSLVRGLDADGLAATQAAWQALDEAALEALQVEGARTEHLVSARYRGQSHALTVQPEDETVEALAHAFETAHQDHYGYTLEDTPIEIVTARSRAVAEPALAPRQGQAPAEAGSPEPIGTTQLALLDPPTTLEVPVLDLEALAPGHQLAGPALLSGRATTAVLPPGWQARVHATGHLLLEEVEA